MSNSSECWGAGRLPGLEILEFILALNDHCHDPGEAIKRVLDLQSSLEVGPLRVVWDLEPLGGAVTYAILLSENGVTYSWSASRDSVIPWPLRGASQADASILLSVNGRSVTVSDAISRLDAAIGDRRFARSLIHMAIMRAEAERSQIVVSEEELDRSSMIFWKARGVEGVDERDSWMRSNGYTTARLRSSLREVLAFRKLREKLAIEYLQSRPTKDRSSLFFLRCASISFSEERLADVKRLLPKCENSLLRLGDALARGLGSVEAPVLYFGRLLSWELLSEHQDLSHFAPEQLSLVQMVSGEWRLIHVFAVELSAPELVLDRRLIDYLCECWCDEQQETAVTEWNWGRSPS